MHYSGRVYRGLLCRNRVGFSPDVESALMSTMDHSKIGVRWFFLAILATLRETIWIERAKRERRSRLRMPPIAFIPAPAGPLKSNLRSSPGDELANLIAQTKQCEACRPPRTRDYREAV